jgi:uncharacterized protein (DUF1015 family)
MTKVSAFRPYRYSPDAGRLSDLVTQPYDKISPAMRTGYLARNPSNLVRVVLNEPTAADSEANSTYTRASQYLKQWMSNGTLVREAEPCLFAYFQEFSVPDTGQKLLRKGFIGVGAVEDYDRGIVFRHEQTLSGPKKDRLELLRHTHAHPEQLFMLYDDPAGEIDRILDQAAARQPDMTVEDEYGARHKVWKISGREQIARIEQLMADKKLLIADGHHRYETALAFRKENPNLPGAAFVQMTFVNMRSPGLQILATHRVVSNLEAFDAGKFLERAGKVFDVQSVGSIAELQRALAAGRSIGAAIGDRLYVLRPHDAAGKLDITILHELLLGKVLGVTEAAVRDEKHLRYVRGLDKGVEEARSGNAQIAFLLKATAIEDVARISFGGGVMPQKSTDFYPKLLSGLTIYTLDDSSVFSPVPS